MSTGPMDLFYKLLLTYNAQFLTEMEMFINNIYSNTCTQILQETK